MKIKLEIKNIDKNFNEDNYSEVNFIEVSIPGDIVPRSQRNL